MYHKFFIHSSIDGHLGCFHVLLLLLLSRFSRVRLCATPWTMARQVPLSIGFSRQEYWSGLPFPSPVRKYEVSEASELKSLSHVWLFANPWTIQSMEFSRPDTGVGSLSLLQGISPTHESNQGLLHCRRILYQLSYQASPEGRESGTNWESSSDHIYYYM